MSRFAEPPQELLDRRDTEDGRAVLSDWLAEHGYGERLAKPLHRRIAADAADDAADDADADAADDAADADAEFYLRREELMKNGLKILQFRGRYNYLTTVVGWCRRVGSERYELAAFRVISRTGGFSWDGLTRLAAEGLIPGYQATKAAPVGVVREFLDGDALNVHTAIEASWATECPRPSGWSEE